MTGSTPIFQARGVEKAFPGVMALSGVDMTLHSGSIHALLGENGAGKSTLIKVITGVHAPTAGTLTLDGKPVSFFSPRDAIVNGIGVVHQERNLFPRFSVAENIHLEQLAEGYVKPIDYRALNEAARPWLKALDLDIDPATPVSDLSVARMQLVEIAKALSLKAGSCCWINPPPRSPPAKQIACSPSCAGCATVAPVWYSSVTNWKRCRKSVIASPCCAMGPMPVTANRCRAWAGKIWCG